MVARHGIQLAAFIIKSHFGDLVSKVCECLLNRGSLSLQELARFVEIDADDSSRNNLLVKNCLLVLIQHNCVQAFSVPKLVGIGGVAKPLTKYFALHNHIIHRLRFAKFLPIVRSDLGPECETLLEGLLQHGRLTFDQLVQRAVSKQTEAKKDILRVFFNKLVHAQYVERCPRPDPLIITPDESTPRGPRGSKFVVSPSIEQQAIISAVLSDAERFSGISGFGTNTTVDENEKEHHPSVSVGDKRRHEVLESENDVEATITENEVLWRVNFEKFVHCLKKKACVENTRSRLSIDAGIVLEAMIESNCKQKVKEKNSVVASWDKIIEGVKGKPGGNTMTLEQVRLLILEQLECRLCSEGIGESYAMDLNQIIQNCQVDEVEALVLNRYGKEAYRIYRFLAKNDGYTETDQVADKTFVEKKETQVILHKLWKDDYLNMEKVVITGGPQLSYYLWKVKKQFWEHVLNDMYHAILNLSLRAAHMVEQDPEILLSNKGLPDRLRQEKLAQQKRWMILQSSIAKLDDALMLFQDF